MARVDFFFEEGRRGLLVNEVNTIPGSMAKYLWVEPKVEFVELIDAMLEEAVDRPTTHWSTDGADGTALRSAGSIAGKLG